MHNFDPVIIALPEGFTIPTNAGLHGNMQFFEVSHDHAFTVCNPHFNGDTVSYTYQSHDSNEGTVTISYIACCGADADSGEVEGWDVEIACGSDVWGLEDSGTAVRDAVKLHKALGLDKQYKE